MQRRLLPCQLLLSTKSIFKMRYSARTNRSCWTSGRPVVDEIANERTDIKVGKINVDEQPELASQFNIMSIPTLVVMKHGKIANQIIGARPKAQILAML